MRKLTKSLLLLVTLILTPAAVDATSLQQELRVDGSITEALAQAAPGTTVVVPEGVYYEHDIIIKTPGITLRGEAGAIIDGGENGYILRITADSVRVEGLTIRNTGSSHVRDYAAILVDKAKHFVITNNHLENTFFAIYLAEGQFGEVTHNTMKGGGSRETNSGNGVHLFYTQDVLVQHNEILKHRDGIYLEFARRVEIVDNTAMYSHRYGLHYMFSEDSIYSRNTFRNNAAGVAVMYSKRVEMNHNLFADNQGAAAYGMLLKDIDDSTISSNVFRNNTTAIYSEGSNRITLEHNLFEFNGWAVKIYANSTDNVFRANAFIENSFDVSTNSRQNYNTFDGNYWSKYDGYDLEGDGIGDVPHRPVRMYSIIVERNPISLILHRSLFIDVLDLAERVMPALTPQTLVDQHPLMKSPIQ